MAPAQTPVPHRPAVSRTAWCDHFPWLRTVGVAGDPAHPSRWDASPPARLPIRDVPPVSGVVDVVVDDLRAVTLGTLFPRIDRDAALLDCHVPPKRVALLAPEGIARFDDLADRTVAELQFIPRTGASIARKMIGAFIRTTLALSHDAAPTAAPGPARAGGVSAAGLPPRRDVVEAAVAPAPQEELAEVVARRAHRPPRRGVESGDSGDPASGVAVLEKPLAARIDSALCALDPHSREILLARRLPDEPPGFGEIGSWFGHSETRAATAESRASRAVRDTVISPALRGLLDDAIPAPGTPRPLAEFVAAVPGLADTVPSFAGRPAWQFLQSLTGEFVVDEGVVRSTAEPPKPPRRPHRHELVANVLEAAGGPLDATEIHRRLAATDHPLRDSSVRSVLTNSGIFVRVDRMNWALASWRPARVFTGTRDVMRRYIVEAGGSMPLSELAARIEAEFDVAAGSVRHYSRRPPFEVADGEIRFTGEAYQGARRTGGASLHHVRKMVRRDDAWAYPVHIWNPAKRREGHALPNALHTILPPLGEDGTVELPSRLGPQRILASRDRLRIAPIEPFVQDLGLRHGDRAWLIFTDDGRFDVEPATSAPSAGVA